MSRMTRTSSIHAYLFVVIGAVASLGHTDAVQAIGGSQTPGGAPVAAGTAAPQADGPLDLVIRNGQIIDGTGNPWHRADIGIRGDRIVAMGVLDGCEGHDAW